MVALLSSEARMPWPLREMYLAVAISSSVKGFSFCRQGRQRSRVGGKAGRQTGRQAAAPQFGGCTTIRRSIWRVRVC